MLFFFFFNNRILLKKGQGGDMDILNTEKKERNRESRRRLQELGERS